MARAGDAKQIVFDQESRYRLQAGINKVADAVGVTLGPRGVQLLSPEHSTSTRSAVLFTERSDDLKPNIFPHFYSVSCLSTVCICLQAAMLSWSRSSVCHR